jgi:nucleoside-diphosphate-sugar epimerase
VRVFVAGATGAIGRPLVRRLVAAGHTVAAMTRDGTKAPSLPHAVVCDVYDAKGVHAAVGAFAPDAVVNELTDMPRDPAQIGPDVNVRIRTEGHRNLLAAAQAAGARYLAQSVAFALSGEAARAVEELERTTLAAGGVVLRYGTFYGPGTYSEGRGQLPDPPRVHVDEAARRTVEALAAASGVVEIVEDDA